MDPQRRGAATRAAGPLAATLEEAYRAAVARLGAARLVDEALSAEPMPAGPVRLLAIGKAAAPMLAAALSRLGASARDPLCLSPRGEAAPAGARAVHGEHPRPGPGSLAAGAAALEWARAGGGTPALVLLSGGGSALCALPAPGIPFEEKVAAAAALMAAGAPIGELNALRKHLSAVKGGRLALALAGPARVLVLSDVPGDDLATIASGPLVPDPTGWDDVRAAVARAGLAGRLPPAVRALLARAGPTEETPKAGHPGFDGIVHRVLAGPTALAAEAARAARALGLDAEADPAPLSGDVAAVARRLGDWARSVRGGRLLALGGEPTIRLPAGAAAPDGGRAQALALLAARELDGLDAAALAAGSDGRDGPTGRAGAVVDGGTWARARALGLDVARALAEARSGPACDALGATLPRYASGTHLGDLVLVAVR